ncbi:MAG: hypothetical protein K9G67_12900 [Bacteroidales bacterium]|nr:hypothetical protein [Bacteroidales bacterium]MCF8350583.1 hypothetical protein [Bacteroidales bacterium]MCF8377249.1 hypothetical protein [Bacteroidales bacterium]MCF8401995.1 hypothetical protein [Bacteroidales bacterium]
MTPARKYKNKYRIEANRWQFWDYSAPGSYFITICVCNRECILGRVQNGIMELSDYGDIVKNEFLKIPLYHKRVLLDAWVVMPNHVHCIITLGDYDFDNGGTVKKIHEFSLPIPPTPPLRQPHQQIEPTIEEIKQYRKQRHNMIIPKLTGKFQMQTSKQINLKRKTRGRRNWQPDYHDHVIRDQLSYHRIKKYIINNPRNWKDDNFYTESY